MPTNDQGNIDAVPYRTLVAYGLPRLGMGMVGAVVALYAAKFGTDVLLIAPAAMATILALSRVWDGVSDPLVGYLSDQTRSQHGRRRPWMFASAIPLMTAIVMLWSPPLGWSSWELTVWIGIAFLLYETAQSAFLVPHGALGMELSTHYHERTRVFAWQHLFVMIGTLVGLVAFDLINSSSEPRRDARDLALIGGACCAALILYGAWRLPERYASSERPRLKMTKAFVDVFRNPHARILLAIYGIETLGAGAIITLSPYVTQYVLGDKGLATWLALMFLVPQALFTPLWIVLARRVDKKKLWLAGMSVMACGFLGQFMFSRSTPVWLVLGIPAIIGVARGIGEVCAPAIQADVIDYDEFVTNERKEGSYLAVLNMVRKSASAVAPFLTLTALQFTGYVPNAEQNEQTLFVLRFSFGLLPCISFMAGIAILARYSLSQQRHAEIRAALDQRAR